MILIFLGPPGSGKGTQAKRVSKAKMWPQLSTGDMLRSAIAAGTKLGLEAKSYMDKGSLVPDTVVIGMISERTQEFDCKGGFILDGFPRTIPQAEALDKVLTSRSKKIDKVISFEIADTELVGRATGRRTCPKCNSMYHIVSAKPRTEGVCDRCGSKLIQRDDDKTEVISNRLKVYHEQTSPLVEYYTKAGKLSPIAADKSPDEVYQQLTNLLK